MGSDDRNYLLARAQEEFVQAARASNPAVRATHQRLAQAYMARAASGRNDAMADDYVVGRVTSADDQSFPRATDQQL